LRPDEVEFEGDAELNDCRSKISEWQRWAKDTAGKQEELLQDRDRLQHDYDDLQKRKTFGAYTAAVTIGIIAIGMGLGVGLLNKLVLWWVRLASSPAKKQLTAMIVCSVWICSVLFFHSIKSGGLTSIH
jgi:hypothetical protein